MKALPTIWLLTDERLGEGLWDAVRRLPRGAGIVFRHHATAPSERRALALRLRRIARARGLTLVTAGLSGFDGLHWHRGAPRHAAALVTASAHSARELRSAQRAGADIVFLSPAFPTASHPGAPALGPVRFGLMRGSGGVVLALGGVDGRNAARLRADGFGAISAWSGPRPPARSGPASRAPRPARKAV